MTQNCFNKPDASSQMCDNSHIVGVIERSDGRLFVQSLNEYLWGGSRSKFYMRFDYCPRCGKKLASFLQEKDEK